MNQRTKFEYKFQISCDKMLIDHCTTSLNYLESNDLVERVLCKQLIEHYINLIFKEISWRLGYPNTMVNYDLSTIIHRESSEMMNLDDPKVWIKE